MIENRDEHSTDDRRNVVTVFQQTLLTKKYQQNKNKSIFNKYMSAVATFKYRPLEAVT